MSIHRDPVLVKVPGIESNLLSQTSRFPPDGNRKRDKTYSRNLLFLLHIFMRVLSTLRRYMVRLHLKVFSLLSICG
jgi:hypothetical protein